MTTDIGRPVTPNGSASAGVQHPAFPAGGPAAPNSRRLAAPGRRRRPAMLALGLALVTAGAAVAAATTMAAGDRSPVLTVVRQVDAGTAIEAADLGVARVAADPQLDPVPAADRHKVVGQIAGVDLRPGTLLSPSQLDAVAIPGPGQALVGVALAPGRLPGRALRRGDPVLAVVAAGESVPGQSDAAAGQPGTRTAEVVSTGAPAPDGTVVVDLLIAEADAAGLAADAAAGLISLVVLPRAR
jgi:hypothetical protein